MRTSCIRHPEKDRLVIIRKWQVDFCEGDTCAAALLSFFEYWHNIKLEQSQKAKTENDIKEGHHDERNQNESLLQFHTEKELKEGILIYGATKIGEALKYLEFRKVIKISKNPNPRYHFDRTKYFLFNPDVLNIWLNKYENNQPSIKSDLPCVETDERSGETDATITEITPKITSDTLNTPPTPQGEVSVNTKAGETVQGELLVKVRESLHNTFDELFNIFWKEYPKKVGKGAAEKIWKRIKPSRELLNLMLLKINEAKKTANWLKDSGQYIPHPATWLNQKRWEDEYIIPKLNQHINPYKQSFVIYGQKPVNEVSYAQ